MNSIMDIEKRIEFLRETDKASYDLLKRIYRFDLGVGEQVIPNSFKTRVFDYFSHNNAAGEITDSLEEVLDRIQKQKIIKIQNKWTGEGTLFNSIRAERPGIRDRAKDEEKNHIFQLIEESRKNCDFCHPEKYTPEDVFGRINGKHSITAANLAKYDVWSSLVIFRNHNPLEFSFEEFSDYLETGFTWFQAVNNRNPQYKYPFFVWNCLPRAGASQVHGHCQILMSKEPYSRVEILQKAWQQYGIETGDDYFQDIYTVHRLLGLSGSLGDVDFFASITPVKEKEVTIISKNPSKDTDSKKTIFKILRCFIDVLGVYSFNLSISCPAINDENIHPYIIHIVDRGSLLKSTADVGGMELYGSSVAADDPYKVIAVLKRYFNSTSNL